jgi:hypothetical protein
LRCLSCLEWRVTWATRSKHPSILSNGSTSVTVGAPILGFAPEAPIGAPLLMPKGDPPTALAESPGERDLECRRLDFLTLRSLTKAIIDGCL